LIGLHRCRLWRRLRCSAARLLEAQGPGRFLSVRETQMEGPGVRYRILAARCRRCAEASAGSAARAALLRMARGYDRRAFDVENEWLGERLSVSPD
jgi:hypothetical protein